jgi:hypothetical protein
MACALCQSAGATYRLVDGETVDVCEQCVAEYFTADPDDPTCLFCDAVGDYDLEVQEPPTAQGDEQSYETVAENVVCEDDLQELLAEN